MLAQLVEKHPNEVRIVYRNFPLPNHQLSIPAAAAAEAAGIQGKYWEMHDLIFENQQTWAAMTKDQFTAWASDQAAKLGLNQDQFTKDMDSKAITDKLVADQKHAEQIQLPGTPFVLLNGKYFQGPYDLANLEALLKLYTLKQYTSCPPMVIDPKKQYSAVIKTDKGDITVQFFPDKAPMAVNSFVFLARNGWFNDTTFHSVQTDFVAQAGDPSGTNFGNPGYYFNDEISDLKFDKPGMLAMASLGPGSNSNGSQFFITYAALPDLDGKYTIFGQVVQGMDVLKKLTPRDPTKTAGLPPGDKIISVEIQEK